MIHGQERGQAPKTSTANPNHKYKQSNKKTCVFPCRKTQAIVVNYV